MDVTVQHLHEVAIMELTEQNVRERLTELSQSDRRREVFGAVSHEYRLNPPLGIEAVEEFEAECQVSLPDDYRRFIAEIGNGGAGPFYGLHPLGHDENGPWEGCALVGDLAVPFPHSSAWNGDDDLWANEPDASDDISEEVEDQMYERWDRILEEQYWSHRIVSGAVPISEIGCNLRQWLVVTGEQAGFVWNDYRADQVGLFPLKDSEGMQMTFADWYGSWLANPNMRMPKRETP